MDFPSTQQRVNLYHSSQRAMYSNHEVLYYCRIQNRRARLVLNKTKSTTVSIIPSVLEQHVHLYPYHGRLMLLFGVIYHQRANPAKYTDRLIVRDHFRSSRSRSLRIGGNKCVVRLAACA